MVRYREAKSCLDVDADADPDADPVADPDADPGADPDADFGQLVGFRRSNNNCWRPNVAQKWQCRAHVFFLILVQKVKFDDP